MIGNLLVIKLPKKIISGRFDELNVQTGQNCGGPVRQRGDEIFHGTRKNVL